MNTVPQPKSDIAVRCNVEGCGHLIFDGTHIRSRIVDVVNAKAKCRCKNWLSIPVRIDTKYTPL